MAEWIFEARNRPTAAVPGRALAALTDLGNRNVNLYLNQPGDAGGTMDLLSTQCRREYLQPGVHELIVRRDGVAIETQFQLATASPELDDQGGGTIAFGWLGVVSYLSNVFTGPDYLQAAVAQDQAAWNVVAAVQSKPYGDYRLTDGLDTPGQPTKTIEVREEVDSKEVISGLSARESGFDFWTDTARAFRTAWPTRGIDVSKSVVLEHGANCRVRNLQEDTSPGAVVNWVRVKGGNAASVTAEDVTSQATYGRREAVVSYPDEVDPARLQQYANAIIARRAKPTIVPVVQVDTAHPSYKHGALWLGDTAKLRATVGNYMQIDGNYRLVAMHFAIDDDDNEALELELNAL